MSYEVMKAADTRYEEDQVYAITSSLHEAKRSAKILIHDGWEAYIVDTDTPDEWEWQDDHWEQVR